MIKLLHTWILCVSATLVLLCTLTLQSCKDDEPDSTHDDESDTFVAETLPDTDQIETRMDVNAVVFATQLDEIGSLFRNRLITGGIQSAIDNNTELVILDEQSASQFIKDSQKYQQLENFYLRGGLIYFHKPSLQATGLIARLELGVFNPVPDDDRFQPICDAYIFNIQGAEYYAGDVHFPGPYTFEYTDENGNSSSETVEEVEKPSEYIYGRYAENAAAFVNKAVNNLVRVPARSVSSRAANSMTEPPVIPIQRDLPVSLYKEYNSADHHMRNKFTLRASGISTLSLDVRCAYSFDNDMDYYQFHMTEFYPGKQLFQGNLSLKRDIYKDKAGGFALEKLDVKATLCGLYNGARLYAVQAIAPQNHPANGTETTVKGWSVSGTLGISSGGLGFNPGGGYTSTTSITLPFSEMPAEFERGTPDGSSLVWNYNIHTPMRYHKHSGRNGGYNKFSAISVKDLSTEQTWSWIVANSSKMGERSAVVSVYAKYFVTSGAASAGTGKNHSYNDLQDFHHSYFFDLPNPDRYKDRLSIVASPICSASSYLRKMMSENSPRFRFLNDNPERTAVIRENLTHRMSNEWLDIYNELKTMGPFLGVDNGVTFTLRMSNGEIVPLGSTGFTGIHISEDGTVSMVK